MRQSIWPVSVFGLGLLLLIIVLSGFANLKQTRQIDLAKKADLAGVEREMRDNMLTALFVGLCIAAGSVFRITELEREAASQRDAATRAEKQLRQLSQQLVSSQEQERKLLSRELHDEIGQSLTALRLELGHLQRIGRDSPDFNVHLEESKKLAERTLQSARSISMGLRPAMLDELGLGPALQWQAREFSRRFQMHVDLELASDLRHLPDPHRTYLYRMIQECLTNCARHSQAQSVQVTVSEGIETITAVVKDDGVGFEARRPATRGLGILGISERVRELGGDLKIDSEPGRGTQIWLSLPTGAPACLTQAPILTSTV